MNTASRKNRKKSFFLTIDRHVPLKERDIERRKTACEILFDRFKKSHFCIALLPTMKSRSISTIPNAKNHGRPRPTINIATSMQYSWKEGFAVHLVGSEGSCVL